MYIPRILIAAAVLFVVNVLVPHFGFARTHFRLAWSIYSGWVPWGYANETGIVKKWADQYGISIEVVQINDYIESINQYTLGAFDAVTATNMDALTIPAASGVDTSAIILGDFSNGNDGIVLKGTNNLAAIRGKDVYLVLFSVSHYLLARALQTVGLSERDVRLINASDADILSVVQQDQVKAAVLWNPQLSVAKSLPNTFLVFDSSQIPGEIMDLTVANTQVLKEYPQFGKALVGAWYETMAIMQRNDNRGKAAKMEMARLAGTDLPHYEAQLRATRMFYEGKEALDFLQSSTSCQTMDKVRKFAFKHGLFGPWAKSVDAVGIACHRAILGNPQAIYFRFDANFVEQLMFHQDHSN